MLGAGDGSRDVGNTRKGGYRKTVPDACLEDGEGVEVFVPCLEE